ncbi:uncharacterized protein LOC115621922 [Scaptodrosophila lebanonensis]|uniref:Uncharacterized protein LOC115621922 n=1 Tax=Drosophila lebanonensis TaxID=7225 RepID=A0A6J2T3Z5_DROLE|nr:uncharacterized protein LOC115621922 [Scaptodrosophila lebanonensis]
MLLPPMVTHVTRLLHIIISQSFAPLSSVLIVHSTTIKGDSPLQQEYMQGLVQALRNVTAGHRPILLQWLNVDELPAQEPNAFEMQLLQIVNSTVIEGFITLLQHTELFLHARYFATRNANVRLKDKRYLFLCEHEKPADLLAMEVLQFYPHHLMIVPTRVSAVNRSSPALDDDALSATLPHRDINFELWTQKFVGASGNLDAVRLGAFLPNETFAGNGPTVELYPNKLLDLKRRTLRMGSITYVPYTDTNYVAPGAGNVDPINPRRSNLSISYYGSEANIIKTFCEVHNCHLRVEAYGADNWGGIYENETADGMLGDIYTQRVELAIGCIYNWYDGITETSHTIARSAVTILGPAPALVPPWRTNILPFNGATWLVLLGTFGACSLALYVLKYSSYFFKKTRSERAFFHAQKLEKSILDIFALFIQQPSAPTTFDRFAPRIFLATLLCATITLENIYSGQLKSLLTVPIYSAPVDSVQKWAQADWKWAAPSIIWVHTVENSDLVQEQILARNFEVRDYDFLYNASFSPNYGLGVERLASGVFNFGNYVTSTAVENRIVLRDDLYFDWTRAVSIRGWTLMPALNRHIRTLQEMGLYVHWEMEYIVKYLDKKTENILLSMDSSHKAKQAPKSLGVHNITGALFVLAFGLAFASLSFLLDLLKFSGNDLRDLWNDGDDVLCLSKALSDCCSA